MRQRAKRAHSAKRFTSEYKGEDSIPATANKCSNRRVLTTPIVGAETTYKGRVSEMNCCRLEGVLIGWCEAREREGERTL